MIPKRHEKLLQVQTNEDGTYEVFWNRLLFRTRVERGSLNDVLCVGLGFCGEEYEAILLQLTETGKATVTLQPLP